MRPEGFKISKALEGGMFPEPKLGYLPSRRGQTPRPRSNIIQTPPWIAFYRALGDELTCRWCQEGPVAICGYTSRKAVKSSLGFREK